MQNSFVAAAPRAVFAVKKVIPHYEGPILLVRPVFTSDPIEVIDDNGTLTLKSNGQKLKDLLLTTAYMVDTWYDQSGLGRHARQADMFKQPYLAYTDGVFSVDFKYNRWLDLPDETLPAGEEPFSIIAKHGEITNPNGGIIGSGEYHGNNSCNALRRSGDQYVNYFWFNDLYTAKDSYKPGNIVSFIYTADKKHVSAINGKESSRRENVQRYGSPRNTTLGKTYSEHEYLNGTLEFLYITDEVAPSLVSYVSGEWKQMA